MDVIVSGLEPESSFSPSLSGPDKPESAHQPAYPTGQSVNPANWDNSTDSADSNYSTSASSSTSEAETVRNDDRCDKMVEKWRLIRLADKTGRQKKVDDT